MAKLELRSGVLGVSAKRQHLALPRATLEADHRQLVGVPLDAQHLVGCEKGPTAAVCCGFQVSRSIRVCGFDSVPSGQSPVGWRDDRGPKRPAVRPAGGLRAMARRPDRRRTAAIRRVNLQGLGPSTPIKLANSNTSAEPECLENAAMSAFFTGDELIGNIRYQRTAQRTTSAVNCRPLKDWPCRRG